ncbi:MAG: hypothetical protein LBF88_11730 [Planctomycetaceae bacterium]|nr:hypothetical protein [Planctomycetaceae bacterium]
MRTFFIFIKPVWDCILGSIIFLVLISADVLGAEPVYRVHSVYWTEPAVISETVPIRVDEAAISYDFPYEPQIIERRILSTKIVSPATDSLTSNSEIKIINKKPLSPLRQLEEQSEKKEQKTLPEKKPEEKIFVPNHSDQTKLSESSEGSTSSATPTVTSETITETTETVVEEPFPTITFPPLPEESEQILVQKPPQPSQNEPKQTSPVSSTIRGQSSGIAGETEKILEEPLPYPQGRADISTIDPKLLDDNTAVNGQTPEQNNTSTSATGNDSITTSQDKSDDNKSKNENQSGVNGILLLATIISIAMLIYTVVIAFDYHQRWMQSLTAQNRHFSSLSDDTDMEVDLSDNLPLYNGNANIPSLSHFRSESQYY